VIPGQLVTSWTIRSPRVVTLVEDSFRVMW